MAMEAVQGKHVGFGLPWPIATEKVTWPRERSFWRRRRSSSSTFLSFFLCAVILILHLLPNKQIHGISENRPQKSTRNRGLYQRRDECCKLQILTALQLDSPSSDRIYTDTDNMAMEARLHPVDDSVGIRSTRDRDSTCGMLRRDEEAGYGCNHVKRKKEFWIDTSVPDSSSKSSSSDPSSSSSPSQSPSSSPGSADGALSLDLPSPSLDLASSSSSSSSSSESAADGVLSLDLPSPSLDLAASSSPSSSPSSYVASLTSFWSDSGSIQWGSRADSAADMASSSSSGAGYGKLAMALILASSSTKHGSNRAAAAAMARLDLADLDLYAKAEEAAAGSRTGLIRSGSSSAWAMDPYSLSYRNHNRKDQGKDDDGDESDDDDDDKDDESEDDTVIKKKTNNNNNNTTYRSDVLFLCCVSMAFLALLLVLLPPFVPVESLSPPPFLALLLPLAIFLLLLFCATIFSSNSNSTRSSFHQNQASQFNHRHILHQGMHC